MNIRQIPEISDLSTEDKIVLVEELWDSIRADVENLPIPNSHKKVLDERLKKHKENPDDVLTLDDLKQRIEKRK